jgi:hypothetical protein
MEEETFGLTMIIKTQRAFYAGKRKPFPFLVNDLLELAIFLSNLIRHFQENTKVGKKEKDEKEDSFVKTPDDLLAIFEKNMI